MPLPLLCCLIGLAATLIMGLIGALLSRSITQIDRKLDANCEAVGKMSVDMKGYEMLAAHLKDENRSLNQKVDSLTNSHAQIDKFIAVQSALGKLTLTQL